MDVSIVICTKNRASQLRRTLAALGSVTARVDWEAVVVDNGSTDDTRSVIAEACSSNDRIASIFEPAAGLGAAREAGWRGARGAIISFTDDDCYLQPDYVDQIAEVFGENASSMGFVGGRILLFDPEDIALTVDFREEPVSLEGRKFIAAGAFQGANLSVRKDVLSSLGGFDRRLGAGTPYPCEDIDFVAAANWAGIKGGFDPRPVVFHHHGRRPRDFAATMAGYDLGRGAYYIKYVMRRDTRWAYATAWRNQTRPVNEPSTWERLSRELSSASRFVREYGSLKERLIFGTVIKLLLLMSRLFRLGFRICGQAKAGR